MRDLLLSIFDALVLHWLVDGKLDLSLVLQLCQNHERLVVVTTVEHVACLGDRLVGLHSWLHLTDCQLALHLLLGAIRHLLHVLEIDHCLVWLTHVVEVGLLLLQLHSHQLVLHLHELVGHHAELLILGVVAAALWVEHHLHVDVWIHVVHSLARESHLVLHHHTWELVHVLHTVHSHWCWHLSTVHAVAVWSTTWLLSIWSAATLG